ncbi:sugar kinase [Agaribacter marinus]|uniref:Sugar kinase n=1 Tax=Virgibacillus salarius TaxID=447199 RepID=A0A941DU06_9BACI|nr:sugar kinase [Virgibacillus salarius]MBR7795711.1 sugar kinase [Virgibacillus salarius]NAZ08424.1 sugar kinase [Agaribacter marinus]
MIKHIAAFGEVMMRLQVPDYKLLSQADSLNYSFSGTGVNITGALTCFGHRGSIVTTLPVTPLGDAAQSFLQKLGIDSSFIIRHGQSLGMYFLENGFGVRPSRVTYSNRMESSFNTATHDFYRFEKLAEQIDIVHFCGITLAMNDLVRQQLKTFAHALKKAGGTIIFDCNFRPSLWGKNGHHQARSHYEEIFELADIVIMNEKDALHTLGMYTEKKSERNQLMDLIPKVANLYNIPIIAGTHRNILDNQTHRLMGFLYKEERFTFSNKRTFSVLDRIGTGDAFASGIIHGLIEDFSNQDIVDFAVASAILAHTTVGDTPRATEKEVLQAMKTCSTDVRR